MKREASEFVLGWREGYLPNTLHEHLLFLQNWDVLTHVKLIAAILYDLFCPEVYKYISRIYYCRTYFSPKKIVDRHKKIHTPEGILAIRTLHVDEVDSKYDKELVQISMFKIQLMTECQSSRVPLNFSVGGGNWNSNSLTTNLVFSMYPMHC